MKQKKSRHHGFAMFMVLMLVSTASILAYALLASAALQAEQAQNGGRAAVAEYMTGSAIETAAYYLQNSSAPAPWQTHSGYTLYARGVSVPSAGGSFDVDAAPTTVADEYTIHATGYSNFGSLTRTITATIKLARATPTFSGGIYGFTFSPPARYTFTPAFQLNPTGFVIPKGTTGLIGYPINYYGGNVVGGTYTMPDGSTGKPDQISGTINSAPTASINNPGNVFYSAGDLTISKGMNITGTLIVRGNLTVKPTGGSSAVTITRVSGFPALIVDNQMKVQTGGASVVANGVVWFGQQGPSLASGTTTVAINGSLLLAYGATLPSLSGSQSVSVTYNSIYSDVTNLTTTPQTVSGVKLETATQ